MGRDQQWFAIASNAGDANPAAIAVSDVGAADVLVASDFSAIDLAAVGADGTALAAEEPATPTPQTMPMTDSGILPGIVPATMPATEPAIGPIDRSSGRRKIPVFVTAYIENDASALRYYGGTDRHYTNGIKVSAAFQTQWAADFGRWMPLGDDFASPGSGFAAGLMAGQNMYTPADLRPSNPDPTDEPYAGWLYGGMFMQRANERVMDHLELDLGTVGPSSFADKAQMWVHGFTHSTEPRGWNHQLHDEIAFDLTVRRKWRFNLPGSKGAFAWQAIPQVGTTLGTVHRQFEGGATLRVGWNLPDDFGAGRINDIAAFTGSPAHWHHIGGYIFGRLGGRLVEHNLFLDGNTFRPGPRVSSLPAVGEAQFGLAIQFLKHVEIAYSQTHMTKEFRTQKYPDDYGTVTVTFFGQF